MTALAPRTTFATSRLLEFCSAKELTAQTGHEPADWPLVVVKELVDNALDACEEAGIAPVIRVTVARGRIRVRDNGPGIPAETVASILDFTTRTSSREAYVAPDRGRQGNALKTILAMPFALSGDEGRVEITAHGIRHEIIFRVDRIAQRPMIDHRQHPAPVRTGTAITVHWPEFSMLRAGGRRGRFLTTHRPLHRSQPASHLCAVWIDDWRRERWTSRQSIPTGGNGRRRRRPRRTGIGPRIWNGLPARSCPTTGSTRRCGRCATSSPSSTGSPAPPSARPYLTRWICSGRPLERLLDGGGEFDHDLVERLLQAMQTRVAADQAEGARSARQGHHMQRHRMRGGRLETYRYKMIAGVDDGVPWLVEVAFACLRRAGSPHADLWHQLVAGARRATPSISATCSAAATAASTSRSSCWRT